MLRIVVACALLSLIANAHPAGFDCKKAATTIEKSICADSHLSALDYLLTQYYQQATGISTHPQPIKDSQKKWLADTRNQCLDIACLKNAYFGRLTILKTAILSSLERHADFSGSYESSHGEILVQQLPGNKIKFDLFVTGPYDKNKLSSPKSNQVEGEALLVGNTASYNEDEDCGIIFSFSPHKASVLEYGCWEYAATSTGIYKRKGTHPE